MMLYRSQVLIVDDSHINVKITQRLLEHWGFSSDIAIDGWQALSMTYRNQYELILLDYYLPFLNANEVIEAMRWNGNNSKVILTSGSLPEEIAAKDLDIEGFLQKPYFPEDLLEILMPRLENLEIQKSA